MYELLRNFNRDYALEVYFKENLPVGHKSTYTMGELAHHLMIEGQFSLSANRRGRPHKQMEVVGRNKEGKYVLEHTTGYKKQWNFVAKAAKSHKNWKSELTRMAEEILVRRLSKSLLNKSVSRINFYNSMRVLAKKVRKDLIEELLALCEPPLSENTERKKKSKKILIETKKLMNSLDVRVVKREPKKSNRINFGRKYSKGNQKLTPEEVNLVKGYFNAGINAEGFLESYRMLHPQEENATEPKWTENEEYPAENTISENENFDDEEDYE